MRKLPRHIHYPEESSPSYQSVTSIDSVPVLDWTKMAFQTWQAFQAFINVTKQNIVDIIGDIVTFVEWTVAQVQTVFVQWSKIITALGNVAWSYVTKTAQNIMDTLVSWANMISIWGNLAWSQITKTASDIMATISTWANIIAQVGGSAINTSGAIATGAISTLGQMVTGFFTATTDGWAKFADQFVTAIKIADGNITVNKLPVGFLGSINFVLNNGFESDIDNDGNPDGWTAGAWSGSPTWGRSTTEVKSGKYSFFLNCPVGASAVLDYLQLIPILPSTQYYYGIQAKGSVANTPCGVAINWYQKDKTTYISTTWIGSGLIGTSWDIRDGTVTSPSNAGWAQIEIFTSIQSYSYILYIDDVVFTTLVTSGIIKDLAITTAKIDSLAVTEAKIGNLAVTNAKIDSLAVTEAKIGSLAVTEAKIGALAVTNAKINDLDAGKINTGYLSASRLDASVAYITNTLMLSNLVVTTANLAELLGIKSAEIPVLDPPERSFLCSALKGAGSKWCPTNGYTVIGKTVAFNAYTYIKHELKKVAVDVEITWNEYVVGGTVYLRCMYSVDGSNWNSFGSELSWIDTIVSSWTEYTFTGNVLTTLNQPFYVRLEAKIYNAGSVDGTAIITLYTRSFELRERAFRSQRGDI